MSLIFIGPTQEVLDWAKVPHAEIYVNQATLVNHYGYSLHYVKKALALLGQPEIEHIFMPPWRHRYSQRSSYYHIDRALEALRSLGAVASININHLRPVTQQSYNKTPLKRKPSERKIR